ncbi:unnamed protein product [Rotaria sp. Silwood1]|nr:unnamed protein product [Rotaria sp. Silwood1]CAF3431884.1 unnamed protein product [Rotaria sp. Silwood1]CAF3518881.1 unnamed protein product [Rotaria sp. Silwood1]CAF4527261.1 unnamed protein product [Rotaria sp. Silwood1]CAF4807450.1 unnamed protein product [Rotaria sp. Silwood1]
MPTHIVNTLKTTCPIACCPMSRQTRENTTCCNPPTQQTTTITIFGYHWWTIFLCAFCLIVALTLLANINKHLHILKRWKSFNSVVSPSMAYTISANDSSNNSVQKFSAKDDTIILEQHPPCYKDVVPATQPPYASVNPPTKTDLE